MSIQIDLVRICGFRGISNIEVSLPRVTVLLRQNNVGKTPEIKALQIALGDYSGELTMKCMEKDIVSLIGICEEVFPNYRAKTAKELDEEGNNAFVAVTRAKRRLYVSYPKQRMIPWGDRKFQRKSRLINEIKAGE